MERGSALLALPFPAALFVGSVEESGTDNVPVRSFSQFETRASEIATGVQRRFAARVDHGPVGFSFRASDPGHLSVRDRFLAEHFQAQGGHVFLRTEERRPLSLLPNQRIKTRRALPTCSQRRRIRPRYFDEALLRLHRRGLPFIERRPFVGRLGVRTSAISHTA